MLTFRLGRDDAWVAGVPMAGELRELTLALLTPVVVIAAVDIGAIVEERSFGRMSSFDRTLLM